MITWKKNPNKITIAVRWFTFYAHGTREHVTRAARRTTSVANKTGWYRLCRRCPYGFVTEIRRKNARMEINYVYRRRTMIYACSLEIIRFFMARMSRRPSPRAIEPQEYENCVVFFNRETARAFLKWLVCAEPSSAPIHGTILVRVPRAFERYFRFLNYGAVDVTRKGLERTWSPSVFGSVYFPVSAGDTDIQTKVSILFRSSN